MIVGLTACGVARGKIKAGRCAIARAENMRISNRNRIEFRWHKAKAIRHPAHRNEEVVQIAQRSFIKQIVIDLPAANMILPVNVALPKARGTRDNRGTELRPAARVGAILNLQKGFYKGCCHTQRVPIFTGQRAASFWPEAELITVAGGCPFDEAGRGLKRGLKP